MLRKIPCKNSEKVNVLVIGDTHFHKDTPLENEKLSSEIQRHVREKKPDFVVMLGDTLHDHETVRVGPHKEVYNLMDTLVELTYVVLIIGNHDLIDASQFLTDNHIFTPYKRWEKVIVVDSPVQIDVGELSFIACPYVERGRFMEALKTLDSHSDIVWELADCIFAHQEFKDGLTGKGPSKTGDKWSTDLPPVISGHLHEEHTLDSGVYYPGSSNVTDYGCTTRRYLWYTTFTAGKRKFHYSKLPMVLTRRKTEKLKVEELEEIDPSKYVSDSTKYKLAVQGTVEDINLFKQSEKYRELNGCPSVSFAFTPTMENESISQTMEFAKDAAEEKRFESILEQVVAGKAECVQIALKEMFEEAED